MTTDFTTTVTVGQTPNEVFDAINNVRGWWSEELEGSSTHKGDVFNYHYEDIHRCTIEVIESVPGKKVVWLVKDNYFKPGIFNGDEQGHALISEKVEWVDTRITFEIEEKDGKTHMRFTHHGLVPDYECYDACSTGWTHYIATSLRGLITTGKGEPNATGKPQTTEEKKLKSEDTA